MRVIEYLMIRLQFCDSTRPPARTLVPGPSRPAEFASAQREGNEISSVIRPGEIASRGGSRSFADPAHDDQHGDREDRDGRLGRDDPERRLRETDPIERDEEGEQARRDDPHPDDGQSHVAEETNGSRTSGGEGSGSRRGGGAWSANPTTSALAAVRRTGIGPKLRRRKERPYPGR